MYDGKKLPINCLLYIPEETKENHSQVITNTDPMKTAGSSPIVHGQHFTAQREKAQEQSFFPILFYVHKKEFILSAHV